MPTAFLGTVKNLFTKVKCLNYGSVHTKESIASHCLFHFGSWKRSNMCAFNFLSIWLLWWRNRSRSEGGITGCLEEHHSRIPQPLEFCEEKSVMNEKIPFLMHHNIHISYIILNVLELKEYKLFWNVLSSSLWAWKSETGSLSPLRGQRYGFFFLSPSWKTKTFKYIPNSPQGRFPHVSVIVLSPGSNTPKRTLFNDQRTILALFLI